MSGCESAVPEEAMLDKSTAFACELGGILNSQYELLQQLGVDKILAVRWVDKAAQNRPAWWLPYKLISLAGGKPGRSGTLFRVT